MELKKGTVDFIASNEYMNRPPMPPTYVFVLDVSKPAYRYRIFEFMLQYYKECVRKQLITRRRENPHIFHYL